MKDKINLIYITSLGHSGSTLLDLLLGSHPEIESVGEIIQIENYIKNNKNCTCGKEINVCNYWNEILPNFEKDISEYRVKNIYDMRNFYKNKKNQFIDRVKVFLNIKDYFDSNFIWEYGLKNYLLFKNILNYTGKKYILDSSKNATRLYLLKESDLFDIKVIYLFRDGRANLESKKRKANDSSRGIEKYSGTIPETFKLGIRTIYIRRILQKHFELDNIYGIKYKDYTKKPEEYINKIINFINVNNVINISKLIENINNNTNHNIDGNRLRFSKIKEIKYINKWEKGLSKYEKFIFKLIGGDFLNKRMNQFIKYL